MAPASAAFALSLIFSLDSSRVSALAPGLRVPPLPLGTINASALEQRHRTIIGVVLGTKKRRTWGNFTTNHNFLLAELPSVKNWRIDLLTVSSRTSLCCRKCQLLLNINATHFFRSPLFKRTSPVVLPRTHDHHFSTSLTLLSRRHSMRPLPLWYLVSTRTTKHTRHYRLPRATCAPFQPNSLPGNRRFLREPFAAHFLLVTITRCRQGATHSSSSREP